MRRFHQTEAITPPPPPLAGVLWKTRYEMRICPRVCTCVEPALIKDGKDPGMERAWAREATRPCEYARCSFAPDLIVRGASRGEVGWVWEMRL